MTSFYLFIYFRKTNLKEVRYTAVRLAFSNGHVNWTYTVPPFPDVKLIDTFYSSAENISASVMQMMFFLPLLYLLYSTKRISPQN